MPHETAVVSAQVLCTPYNHASCHFMQSHIRKVYASLAVTCHLHIWQNDRDLLRATAVTRGWNRYRNRVSTESRPWRRKFSRCSYRDLNPGPFSHESGALTTELSQSPFNSKPRPRLFLNPSAVLDEVQYLQSADTSPHNNSKHTALSKKKKKKPPHSPPPPPPQISSKDPCF